ncbi:MAG: tRNA pseudouridine(38-40) synthase TruA [Prolixibacteraceae bacterium]|nr:tRNA pseudouridine(38-40) synthase TruA [Prolixibacteraceae bacterium]
MQRYVIQLSYNGSGYCGWQIQPNALSVQQELTSALHTLTRKKVEVTGAGRTDAGVHASFYIAHFDLPLPVDNSENFCFKLNAILSKDILIRKIIPVENDFHARFSALSRTYQYFLSNRKEPFRKEFVNFCPYDLDVDLMNKGAEMLKAYTDFTSFSKLHTDTKTNNCKIEQAFWVEKNGLLVFEITADRFLRNMVRAIVGTLIDLGREKISLTDIANIIESKNRGRAGASVPANALFLTNIVYPGELNNRFFREPSTCIFQF